MIPMLAAVSGQGTIRHLLIIFAIVFVGLIIWALGRHFFPKPPLNMPPAGMMIWDGIFILVGAFALINFILTLIGYPIVTW